ncbi:hypothetical protein CPB84DRAFT_254592 [Gymnopilus junonius]|uniref:Fungal-type protein kinase domain-containing protein n=1 Tax=Gymnopilus junonius TaxID=109634 RepID=A0A9P5NED6_GYMJU|nr:hypothetical protein CPB84DRAFT_254592 [Gymnopilus junonius]
MSRDDILNRLLRNTLESVQPISSDVEVNKLLITLATAFQGTKTAVWSSYVRLCNDVLDRLGNLIVNPVQCPDALNIRFQHDNCYPRVVISSTVALLNAHGDPNPDFTNPPPCQLPWQITLASNEFDVNNERYPKGVVSYLESHVFTSETRNNSLLNAVGTKAMDEEGLEGHNQIHIRPKRSRDVATLGSDEEQPSIKRTRTPSGSKGNSPKSSPTWEITVEQGTKEAKARRFECASYALDMLSYGAGIHHAINLLLTNGVLNILYCDRQGIIQSTGISIFHDFSRFLVLLLAFQRFSVKDWGVIPSLNPKAVYELYRPRPTQPSAECQNEVSPEGNREDPALPVVLRLHQDLDNPKDFANFWQETYHAAFRAELPP